MKSLIELYALSRFASRAPPSLASLARLSRASFSHCLSRLSLYLRGAQAWQARFMDAIGFVRQKRNPLKFNRCVYSARVSWPRHVVLLRED